MSLAVVVPSHQTRELTLRCLASLAAHGEGEVTEQVVVDDGSTDGTGDEIAACFPSVTVIRHERPRGFTAAANRGVDACTNEIVLLLNSDTEVLSGSLPALGAAFRNRASLGVAGSRLLYPDGSGQWSHGPEPGAAWCFAVASGLGQALGRARWWRRWRDRHAQKSAGDVQPAGWVTGAALAFRREVWRRAGPLEERFRFYAQDLDFCIRARDAGWEVGVVRECVIVHLHGATIGRVHPGTAVGRPVPCLLWPDLVDWARRRGGARRARHTARALAAGGRLRLLTLWLASLRLPASRAVEWQRERQAITQGLAALAVAVDECQLG